MSKRSGVGQLTDTDGWWSQGAILPAAGWNETSVSVQIVVEGKPGRSAGSSVAIFEIHITPGYCLGEVPHKHICTSNMGRQFSHVRMESICAAQPELFSLKAFGTFPVSTPTPAVPLLIYPVLLSPCPDCDFEESHLCGYSNQWNANVNWFVGGGGTQLFRNDIPDDHTYNNKTGEKCNGRKESGSVCVCVWVFLEILSRKLYNQVDMV